ncbi:MAG: HAD hydrolase family protein, partial [Planctomycetota bacterium]|nr:HAD hydrolase family protein [Planctomycetota bacterium]
CEKLAVAPEETIYIGDDLNDLPAMELAGFSACPADARPEVRARVDLVLATRGGAGVFRELADMLLDTIDLQAPPAGEGQS